MKSADYIYGDGSGRFVDALLDECLAHPAVRHPYLRRLADGHYPVHHLAVRDYARQYGVYSASFTQALRNVRDRIRSEQERQIIDQNLLEEEGDSEAINLAELPHRELFRRFSQQVGANDTDNANVDICLTVRIWTRLFLEKCATDPVEVGIGAIGLGTELVVPCIYPMLLQAVDRVDVANPQEARMFFALHLGADDDHGKAFVRIAKDHATTHESREALRFGALSSLNLRQSFYDVMDARASGMKIGPN
jgi:pyrroloquinoline quinone (PQQ) biosynthesis protein C